MSIHYQNNKKKEQAEFDNIISTNNNFFLFNLIELFKYKNLIYMLVKRDFVTFYKQTILGPLWYVIQPLVNTLVFTIIFGRVAQISTDSIPPFLFYLIGNVVWAYFATCATTTSNTFISNVNLFSKVYFPRLTVPISVVIISILQFVIQFIIFLLFYFYFYLNGMVIQFNWYFIFIPLLVLQMGIVGMGVGIIISSLTTKYRDLSFVVTFGIQLWMFATPIVYPFSLIPDRYKMISALNPMTSVVENFKFIFFQRSGLEFEHILIGVLVSVIIFAVGILLFSKMERNFIDTI